MADIDTTKGYVKLWRKTSESGLMQMPTTFTLFVHILMNATHKDLKYGTKYGVIELKRGQFIGGYNKLSSDLNQTIQQLRTSVKRLENLGILTIKTTNKYSIYTIENYDFYQSNEREATSTSTNKQQANNKQTTTEQTHKHINIKKNTSPSRVNNLQKPVDNSEKKKKPVDNFDPQINKIITMLKRQGFENCFPSNPRLLAMVASGKKHEDFKNAVHNVPKGKPMNYLLSKMEKQK